MSYLKWYEALKIGFFLSIGWTGANLTMKFLIKMVPIVAGS